MRIGAGLSTETDSREAAIEAAMVARRSLDEARTSLALVFASPHHAARASALLDAVHEACRPEALIGCVGEAVLGGRREVEGEPAVAVWLGALDEGIETFQVEFQATEEAGVFTGWPEEGNRFLLVCDPFTFPADLLLRELDRRQPGVTVIGGMASGGVETGESRLFLGDRVVSS
ncbi:MAG: FIST N-terminal domain-containing protein, partial [Actinomycetota bacterium]